MYLKNSEIGGNMGFLDQHTAIKWVYENIKSFNGDSGRITLGGRSAGSFSVGYHMIYEPTWPFFQQVILQSGAIFYSKMDLMSSEEASRRTSDVMNNLNCSSEWSMTERVKCLQNHTRTLSFDILSVCDDYHYERILKGNELASQLNPLFHLVKNGIDFSESSKQAFERGDFK
jgi:carboxylesterase type B